MIEEKVGFCALCKSRCGATYRIEDGRLTSAGPAPSHPTGKSLCVKGKAAPVEAYRLVSVSSEAPSRRLAGAMVGRERELGRLQAAMAQAVADGSCQLFTVLGAAGVGKSRLAYAFLDGLGDATVVRGTCLSYGEGITYWPVVEVLKQLLGAEPVYVETSPTSIAVPHR